MALTRASAAVIKTEEIVNNRNRIINGDMRIDQRNAGASVTLTSTQTYMLDRWTAAEDTDGTMTAQQSTVAPPGFTNSFLLTTGTEDSSLSASQFASIRQVIEGYNISDLGWGTADAKTVTLSFWVRSSLTGTFGGSLRQGSARSYVFTYTISSANTWEYKTVTIVGDTSGTWNTTNGGGIILTFALGSGSTFQGTAGTWISGNAVTVAGAVSVIGTAGATFYITGVQLEVGSVATPFERRPYGMELSLCYRYFFKYENTSGGGAPVTQWQAFSATDAFGAMFTLPVVMRAAPTATSSGTFVVYNAAGSSALNVTTFNINRLTPYSVGSNGSVVQTGLVAGNATSLYIPNNGSISLTAEL